MPETKIKSKNSHYKVDSTLDNSQNENEALEPCVQYTVDCWDKWDSHWSNKFSLFEKYYDRWIGKPPKRDEDWQANFHKKLTWQAEKVLVARFHSALFPVSAPIDTEVNETMDEIKAILSKSLVAHWFKIGFISKEFLSGMRSAAIYGTGLFEDGWYVRKELIPEKVEKEIPDFRPMVDMQGNRIFDEEGNIRSEQIGVKKITQEVNNWKIVEDRYRLKKANIFAWRIHPNKLDDDDDYPVIKQEFITYDDLLERQAEAEELGFKGFENMDKIKKDKFKINEGDAQRLQKDGDYVDVKNPRLEILHYWGLYSPQEGEEGDSAKSKKRPMWIIVVNRKYRLRIMDNPFWHKKPPLFHINWTEDEKPSYYGIGLAQIGAEAEDRANTWVNIRTDVKKKCVRGSGWYNVLDKKIKKSQVQDNTPGLMRACSDVNAAVKYDTPPPTDPTDYSEEQTAVNDHRDITGSTTALLPPSDNRQQPDTLGGMQINLSQSIQRLKPDLTMMEMMGIRRIANRAFLLTRQFFSKPEAIEIIASEDKLKQYELSKIYTMTPKDIIGDLHFFCIGLSESVDKMQNIDKALKFMEILQKTTPGHPFINYLIKKIAFWLGFEDAGKFFETLPMAPGMPQISPQMPQGGANMPPGIPMPPPQGNMPIPPNMLPMARPPMPMMPPQGQGQGLSPQLLQMIVQRMMMQRQQPNQGRMI
jgi:hypothetical protein